MLSARETARYRKGGDLDLPIIIVVGPPRSGTTVIFQALVKALPVSYFNNLTSIFPRSPITVNLLAPDPFRNEHVRLSSYYGRTSHWWGPNDGLYLWDRWFERGRAEPKNSLSVDNATAMRQFFGAWTATFEKPLVAKNNGLLTGAHLITSVLPRAHFICVERKPMFLAQSLLRARMEMHGTDNRAYGVDDHRPRSDDPLEDVGYQVQYHAATADQQRAAIGTGRFWSVSYEAFCARPADLVLRVAGEILGLDLDRDRLEEVLPPLQSGNRQKVSDAQFERIGFEIDRLGLNG